MDLNLKGRKVAITGAGDGIGRALALAFAEEGARVAVCARSEKRLDSLKKELLGSQHVIIPADLTLRENLEAFHKSTIDCFGGLDVLVNNVGGIGKLAEFSDLEDSDWEQSFALNLMPTVRLVRLFIHALKHSESPRIINISSTVASRPGKIFPHYSAMKAALSNLTSSLAQTLAKENILINSVSPGPVWTRSWEIEAEQSAKKSGSDPQSVAKGIRHGMAQSIPLGRMGVSEDVTGIVLFLASNRSGWITATDFTVDGGVNQDTF